MSINFPLVKRKRKPWKVVANESFRKVFRSRIAGMSPGHYVTSAIGETQSYYVKLISNCFVIERKSYARQKIDLPRICRHRHERRRYTTNRCMQMLCRHLRLWRTESNRRYAGSKPAALPLGYATELSTHAELAVSIKRGTCGLMTQTMTPQMVPFFPRTELLLS